MTLRRTDPEPLWRPGWLHRLLSAPKGSVQTLRLEPSGLRLTLTDREDFIPYTRLTGIEITPCHRLWRTLTLVTTEAHRYPLRGLNRPRLSAIRQHLDQSQAAYRRAITLLSDMRPRIDDLERRMISLINASHYVSHSEIQCFLQRLLALDDLLNLPESLLPPEGTPYRNQIQSLKTFASTHEAQCARSNERFINQELQRRAGFFDTIESRPLTEAQRRAVVTHQDNTLVLAGAGSGKTSVIISKAAYLILSGLAQPGQILLLAYNQKAAAEMNERLAKRLPHLTARLPEASTFHALGLKIMSGVLGKKPTLSKLTEPKNPHALASYIRETVIELLQEPDGPFRQAIVAYFQSFFSRYQSPHDFTDQAAYQHYIRSIGAGKNQGILTLKGDICKSFEECEIANFLSLNGIDYHYEAPYEHPTATQDRRQYLPDFSLYRPDGTRVYLEHFALDINGKPPLHFGAAYLPGVYWKRQLHQANGTCLLETYSWQKRTGSLLPELKKALHRHGFTLTPIPVDELLEQLGQANRLDSVSHLMARFLSLYKGQGYHHPDIASFPSAQPGTRLAAFMEVFEPVLQRYNQYLANRGEIDFDDMITEATAHVRSGRYISPYTCLLVDEFQDISQGRARLIKALARQSATHRLFCVGDDWQSIYRFSGSDLTLMLQFESQFGVTAKVALDKTFRFNDRIEAVATPFICKNPDQLAKPLSAVTFAVAPAVHLHHPECPSHRVITNALDHIAQDAAQRGIKTATVGILSRYNTDPPPELSAYPALKSQTSTIHKAKGLEWDYVIVLDLKRGSFPCVTRDDPLLNAVLPPREPYPDAEERRLFYVALTRARHAVHLLLDYRAQSEFTAELTQGETDYPLRQHGPPSCPSCHLGGMVIRQGPFGPFLGCNRFPSCHHTQSLPLNP